MGWLFVLEGEGVVEGKKLRRSQFVSRGALVLTKQALGLGTQLTVQTDTNIEFIFAAAKEAQTIDQLPGYHNLLGLGAEVKRAIKEIKALRQQ